MNLNNNITIIIILYNSSNLIFDCLKSLSNFKIIVVDNGKNFNVLSEIKKRKNIKVISKNKNLGFGNGVNFAFNEVQTEYFLLLNPDIVIDEKSILLLLNTALSYENCAIAAPLNVPDKDSYGILPEKRNIYEKNKLYFKDNIKKNFTPVGEICVDVSKGCALLIKSKYFYEVNLFSKKYFLFWEEIDLCRKFRSKKLSVIVTPKSSVEHKQEKSSDSDFQNFLIKTYYHEYSPLVYFNVQKFSLFYLKRMMKYMFRGISYLMILNFKKSLVYFLRLGASVIYFINLKFSSKK